MLQIKELAEKQAELYPDKSATLDLFNGQLSQRQASRLDSLMALVVVASKPS